MAVLDEILCPKPFTPKQMVLEIDQKTKRADWQLAIIEEVQPGSDGLVRKVKIKTAKGTYERPIAKLCLIATRQELEDSV